MRIISGYYGGEDSKKNYMYAKKKPIRSKRYYSGYNQRITNNVGRVKRIYEFATLTNNCRAASNLSDIFRNQRAHK